MIALRLIVSILLLSGVAHAQPARLPVLDAAQVPGLDPPGREQYLRLARQNHPRVFVASPDGKFGTAWGYPSVEVAESTAMENCRKAGGTGCATYLRNNQVVWPGRAWNPPTMPGRLSGGVAYDIIPDERFLWWGARDAAGVYVWGHGRGPGGVDSRGLQPQAHVRWFNNAGYDVLRFDRHPNSDDTDRAAGWLRDALATLRASGYRRVIVGGQSRGAWNALMMLDQAGLADAVIAIAPARHGDGVIGNPNYPRATEDLREMLSRAASPRARVVMASFEGDNFVPDAEARSRIVRELLPARSDRFLWIDRPGGFTGHGAGANWRFSDAYGGCILRFVTLEAPPITC